MIECCDGCLRVAKKYVLRAGQWLCPDCAEHGTPMARNERKKETKRE